MKKYIHILGIPGSLRQGSYNLGLLHAATELLPDGASLEIVDLSPIPLFNADLKAQGEPGAVLDFKARIAAGDHGRGRSLRNNPCPAGPQSL